jgi:putative tryptophan/tyrosine transport system substrate-binding protein
VERRAFITLLGGAAAMWPLAAGAQQGHIQRIAVLTLRSQETLAPLLSAFLDELQHLGYVEGQNVTVDYRWTDGDVEPLQPLARELLALKPDVALAAEPSAARAMKSVASFLPIVCISLTDAVIPELAASYARPGGTVTGIALTVEGMTSKLVELTVETVPTVARIGFLHNPAGASMRFFADSVAAGARTRGITLLTEKASTRDDLSPAINRLAEHQVQALVIPSNGLFYVNRAEIAQLALSAHLPTVFPEREYVEAGGLASYGIDVKENYRHAARYIGKILKGAKAGDLPIEFPTKVELVINLKTARALGLEVPATLLARADEVVD